MDQIPFYDSGGTIDVHRLIGRVEIDALTPMRRWLMGTIPCRLAQALDSGSPEAN
jgi:hypothetical protein